MKECAVATWANIFQHKGHFTEWVTKQPIHNTRWLSLSFIQWELGQYKPLKEAASRKEKFQNQTKQKQLLHFLIFSVSECLEQSCVSQSVEPRPILCLWTTEPLEDVVLFLLSQFVWNMLLASHLEWSYINTMKQMRLTLNILSLYCFKLSKGDHTFCLIYVWHSLTAFFCALHFKAQKCKKSILLRNCKNSLILKILFHFQRIFSPSGPFLTHTCQQSHSSKVHISSSIDQRTFIPHIHRPDWLTPTEPQWAHTRRQMEGRPSPVLQTVTASPITLLTFTLFVFLSSLGSCNYTLTHRFVQKKEKATSSLT